jgi:hypothetical protein
VEPAASPASAADSAAYLALAELETALDAFSAGIVAIRRERLTRDLPGDSVANLFALGFALEQLRQDARDLAARIAEWSPAAGRRGLSLGVRSGCAGAHGVSLQTNRFGADLPPGILNKNGGASVPSREKWRRPGLPDLSIFYQCQAKPDIGVSEKRVG